MPNKQEIGLLEDIQISSLTNIEHWRYMTNDIERYHNIRSLVIDSLSYIASCASENARVVIEAEVSKLEEQDEPYEYDELVGFLTLANILSSKLYSNLEKTEIPEYATPHTAITLLYEILQQDKAQVRSSKDVSKSGTIFSIQIKEVKEQIDTLDWQRGWR